MPKKIIKYLLLAVGVLLALVLAAVAYIAATFNPNEHKPRLVAMVKEATGRTLAIPGDIRLTFFPRLGVELGTISLSEPGDAGVFASAERLHVAVALLPLLDRQVEADRVLIDRLTLNVRRDRQGRYNFDDLIAGNKTDRAKPTGPASAPEAGTTLALALGGISVNRARLDYQDNAQGRHLRVDNLNMEIGPLAPGRKSTITIAADITADQPRLALQLALKSGFTPDLANQTLALEDLAASLQGAMAQQTGLLFKLDVPRATASPQAVRLPSFTIQATVPNPTGGTLAALQTKGQADAQLAAQTASVQLDGKLDATTFTGKVGVRHYAQPEFDFDLNLGELDVDRYLPRSGPTKTPPAPAAGSSAGPAVIDLSALGALRARGSLRVAALKVMDVRASSIRAQLVARNGQAVLDPLTATLYGGGVNGTLSVAAGQPQRLSARLDLRGINIGPLLKDMLDRQPVDGRGNLAVNVQTEGKTSAEFKRALNGTAGLQLQDGAINGINIAAAVRDAQTKLSAGPRQGTSSAQEKTDFTEFAASFKIKDGVAHNDDLSAKTPLLRLGGSGDVFIAEDRLDYTVKATVVPTLQGQEGPELAQLKGLTIPVRLSGPYASIAWKVDLGGLATNRARELIDQRKEQLQQDTQQRLREQAEDKLKNLLRR